MDFFLKCLSVVVIAFVVCSIFYDAIVVAFPRVTTGGVTLFKEKFFTVRWFGIFSRFSEKLAVLRLYCLPFFKHPYIEITLTLFFNRLVLFLLATVAYSILEDKSIDFFGHFQNIWNRWDSSHYMRIAEYGYPVEGDLRNLLVFYPMYPLLIKISNLFIANIFLAGIFTSCLCLLLSLFVLYRLSVLEFSDKVMAKSSVHYLLLFPLSFFGSMVYTESTFLLFSITCFYCIRREWWWAAGLCGMMAAFTRNQGVILFAPMMYEIVRISILNYREGNRLDWGTLFCRLSSSLLIPLGILFYLCVNKYVSGDWFRFLEYQKNHWGQEAIFFGQNIDNIYDRIDWNDTGLTVGTWLPTVFVFVLCLILLPLMTQVLPTAYVLYSCCFFVISFAPSWLLSGPRYIFVLFPLYMVMAKVLIKFENLTFLVKTSFSFITVLMIVALIRNNVF